MTTIAITGVSGLIGRRLVRDLERRSDVARIVGIDRYAPRGLTSARLVFRQDDVRSASIADAFSGVDVVVHLAFQMDPVHDEVAMREINVDGTRNVVEAAERAGVAHLVYPSSIVAYGAYADNDLPLTEDSPVRGTPELDYSEHKRDVEHWLATWSAEPRRTQLTILRPAIVLGPGIQNFMTRLLEGPRFTTVRDHEPPLQFVHLDDVISAIVHVIEHRLTGVYNVCAEGWLAFDEVLEVIGRRVLDVPEEVAFATAERLWKLGIGEHPPGIVHHLMHPCVMSPAKLVATGWQPRVTNRAALQETVREHEGFVAVAGVRTRWSTVRRAGATFAMAVALIAAAALRRRHRRGAHVVRADAREGSGSAGD